MGKSKLFLYKGIQSSLIFLLFLLSTEYTIIQNEDTEFCIPERLERKQKVLSGDESTAKCLFISEYIEGSGNNKCLELYNPGSDSLDLESYELQFFFNGNTSPSKRIPLSGVVDGAGTFVVCDDDAIDVLVVRSDMLVSGRFYNGNDAIVLLCQGDTLDVIGKIGENPGSQWGSGLVSTANNTLRRLPEILCGDSIASDHFEPADEWIGFPSDNFEDLGDHTVDVPCSPEIDSQSIVICGGDTILFGDQFLYAPGIYMDTIKTTFGCDSILIRSITVLDPPELSMVEDTFCNNDPIFLDVTRYEHLMTPTSGDFTYKQKNQIEPVDLFFSEYLEGSGNNKCLEIYNGTKENVDLSSYTISIYFNGSIDPGKRISFTGALQPNQTWVICDDGGEEIFVNKADHLISGSFFNGDDAIVLEKDGMAIDGFGQVGHDPGTRWESTGISTANQTLIRRPTIYKGDTLIYDTFLPHLEWLGLSADYTEGLGAHNIIDSIERSPILEPEAYELTKSSCLEVEFTDDSTGCSQITDLRLELASKPHLRKAGIVNKCPLDKVDLRDAEFADSLNPNESGDTTYYLNGLDAALGMNALTSSLVDKAGTYYVRYEVNGCYDTTTIEVILDFCPENCTLELSNSALTCLSDGTYELKVKLNKESLLSEQLQVNVNDLYFDTLLSVGELSSLSIMPCIKGSGDTSFISVRDLASGGLIVTEILADPDAIHGDANGDGVVHNRDDEFIEIYNNYGLIIDLSDYRLSDRTGVRHVFPKNTLIDPHEVLVLYGGGVPDTATILNKVQIASSGSLSLNNNGDMISLINPMNDTMWSMEFGSQASKNQSLLNIGMDQFIIIAEVLDGVYQTPGQIEPFYYPAGEGFLGTDCWDILFFTEPHCPVLDSFDLALRMTSENTGPFTEGDTVIYVIEVYNQGNINAFDIRVIADISDDLKFSPALNTEYWQTDLTSIAIDSLEVDSFTQILLHLIVGKEESATSDNLKSSAELISAYTKKGLIALDIDGSYDIRGGGMDEVNDEINDNMYGEADDHYDYEFIRLCTNVEIDMPIAEDHFYCDDLLSDTIPIVPIAGTFAEDLIISQYIEGSGFNKCIELYNGTGRTIDLIEYRLEIYANGSDGSSLEFGLEGNLARDSTYVICHTNSQVDFAAIADRLSTSLLNFNGNDAIVLRRSGIFIDAIGQAGNDQFFGSNISMVRKLSIIKGDDHPFNPFDFSEEWDSVLFDSPVGLGEHSMVTPEVKQFNFYLVDDHGVREQIGQSKPALRVTQPTSGEHLAIEIEAVNGSCAGPPNTVIIATHSNASDLSCKGLVNIYAGTTCAFELKVSDVLLSPIHPGFIEVEINEEEGLYTLRDICTGNTCTGVFNLKKESLPVVANCPCDLRSHSNPDFDDWSSECFFDIFDNVERLSPEFLAPCQNDLIDSTRVWKTEVLEDHPCQGYWHRVYWIYQGVDKNAIDTLCKQDIWFSALAFESIQMPTREIFLSCESISDPADIGSEYYSVWAAPYFVNNVGDTILLHDLEGQDDIQSTYFDIKEPMVKDRFQRVWHLMDWCSGQFKEYYQWIKLTDDIPPNFNLLRIDKPATDLNPDLIDSLLEVNIDFGKIFHLVELTDPNRCEIDFKIPVFDQLVDNCTQKEDILVTYHLPDGLETDSSDVSLVKGLSLGTNFIDVLAADQAGNVSTQTITVQVLDKASPQANCRDAIRLNLIAQPGYLDGGVARVPIDIFDNGSMDQCGDLIFRLGRRIDNNFFCGQDLLTFISRDYIEFCCEDSGKSIQVEYRIFDASGNSSICTTEVWVEDVSSLTLSCEDVVIKCEEGNEMDIEYQPETIDEVCDRAYIFEYRDSDILDRGCKGRRFRREWIERISGLTCTQEIVIDRKESVDPSGIRWPLHWTGNSIRYSFAPKPPHTSSGVPDIVVRQKDSYGNVKEIPAYAIGEIDEEAAVNISNGVVYNNPMKLCTDQILDSLKWTPGMCTSTGISFEDLRFDTPGKSVYQVLRRWTLIDWCKAESNESGDNGDPDHFVLVDDQVSDARYYRLDTSRSSLDGVYHFNQVFYFDCADSTLASDEEISDAMKAEDKSVVISETDKSAGVKKIYSGPYPNPFDSYLVLLFESSDDIKVQIGIFDEKGQRHYVKEYQLDKTKSSIELDRDFFGLSGLYFIMVEVEGKIYAEPVILMN